MKTTILLCATYYALSSLHAATIELPLIKFQIQNSRREPIPGVKLGGNLVYTGNVNGGCDSFFCFPKLGIINEPYTEFGITNDLGEIEIPNLNIELNRKKPRDLMIRLSGNQVLSDLCQDGNKTIGNDKDDIVLTKIRPAKLDLNMPSESSEIRCNEYYKIEKKNDGIIIQLECRSIYTKAEINEKIEKVLSECK